MMDVVLLLCVVGAVLIAMIVDVGALVGWARRRWR
jgi:hypothetical protein